MVKDLCIQEGFYLQKIKNEKTRYTQKCAYPGCNWRIHCSVLVDRMTWMVKTIIGRHSCHMPEQNRMTTSKWVVNHLLSAFRASLNMKVAGMQEYILNKFGIQVPNYACWRAMRQMREIIEGKHEEGYRMLAHYVEEFKVKNLGSTCFINWIDEGPGKNPTFKHLFISIGAAISLFKEHCRPIIRIDAYHLKELYKVVLMTAMGLDGNNGQFPLAYAVVEKENLQEWSFFLNALVRALDAVENQSKFTILSDRYKATSRYACEAYCVCLFFHD